MAAFDDVELAPRLPKIGDTVLVMDGSSDGHTGTIVAYKGYPCVRIKRDDGQEADVSNYKVLLTPAEIVRQKALGYNCGD